MNLSDSKNLASFLPDMAYFENAFGKEVASSLYPLLQQNVLKPVLDLACRPSKAFRAELVEIGYKITLALESPRKEVCDSDLQICKCLVEFLHAGSLIVDDIQDESLVRRGAESIHTRYGLASAIAVGNWLYFWPLSLLKRLQLNDERTVSIHNHYHRALEYAHYGQNLDVSLRMDEVDREKIPQICNYVLRNKTGAITALSLAIGAIVAGASEELLEHLTDFGSDFGLALQRFDDLGNAKGVVDQAKRWEDLQKRKPSWVWQFVAEEYDAQSFAQFKEAVALLPDEQAILSWFHDHGFFETAEKSAAAFLKASQDGLLAHFKPGHQTLIKAHLQTLCEKLGRAYV